MNMRLWRIAGVVLLAAILIAGVIFFFANPAVPARSLSFTEITTSNVNAATGLRTFVISNSSDHPLLVTKLSSAAGMSQEIFSYVACLTNGIWSSSINASLGRKVVYSCGFSDVLRPHEAVTNHFKMPEYATTFRVGLDFTSLTRAGNMAYRTAHPKNRLAGLIEPVFDRFLQSDIKTRTRTEWSQPQSVTRLADKLTQNSQVPE